MDWQGLLVTISFLIVAFIAILVGIKLGEPTNINITIDNKDHYGDTKEDKNE